ncbi:MAG TPA: DUF6683 family protein [Burkholderiaceae bacterium]|nr:DUF6683 family protein [Burkholderiaceae bacterium]
MLQITSTAQSNLTKQMINMNSAYSRGSGSAPAPCMPPYQLQRGVNGVVPPELQGDPRYQEYLRCLHGQVASQRTAQYAPAPVARRYPISASDFVPVMSGHPVAEQALAGMQLNPKQRLLVHGAVDETFKQVANEFRGNNLAVAMAFAYATANSALTGTSATNQQLREVILNVNDAIAQDANIPRATAVEKQNAADGLIFQSAMIILLRAVGQQDPDARQKSVELARVVMRRLLGS